MKKLNEETVLNLSKNQIQSVINDYLLKEKGLNDLFSMMINGLMLSERSAFLAQSQDEINIGNGYRSIFLFSFIKVFIFII